MKKLLLVLFGAIMAIGSMSAQSEMYVMSNTSATNIAPSTDDVVLKETSAGSQIYEGYLQVDKSNRYKFYEGEAGNADVIWAPRQNVGIDLKSYDTFPQSTVAMSYLYENGTAFVYFTYLKTEPEWIKLTVDLSASQPQFSIIAEEPPVTESGIYVMSNTSATNIAPSPDDPILKETSEGSKIYEGYLQVDKSNRYKFYEGEAGNADVIWAPRQNVGIDLKSYDTFPQSTVAMSYLYENGTAFVYFTYLKTEPEWIKLTVDLSASQAQFSIIAEDPSDLPEGPNPPTQTLSEWYVISNPDLAELQPGNNDVQLTETAEGSNIFEGYIQANTINYYNFYQKTDGEAGTILVPQTQLDIDFVTYSTFPNADWGSSYATLYDKETMSSWGGYYYFYFNKLSSDPLWVKITVNATDKNPTFAIKIETPPELVPQTYNVTLNFVGEQGVGQNAFEYAQIYVNEIDDKNLVTLTDNELNYEYTEATKLIITPISPLQYGLNVNLNNSNSDLIDYIKKTGDNYEITLQPQVSFKDAIFNIRITKYHQGTLNFTSETMTGNIYYYVNTFFDSCIGDPIVDSNSYVFTYRPTAMVSFEAKDGYQLISVTPSDSNLPVMDSPNGGKVVGLLDQPLEVTIDIVVAPVLTPTTVNLSLNADDSLETPLSEYVTVKRGDSEPSQEVTFENDMATFQYEEKTYLSVIPAEGYEVSVVCKDEELVANEIVIISNENGVGYVTLNYNAVENINLEINIAEITEESSSVEVTLTLNADDSLETPLSQYVTVNMGESEPLQEVIFQNGTATFQYEEQTYLSVIPAEGYEVSVACEDEALVEDEIVIISNENGVSYVTLNYDNEIENISLVINIAEITENQEEPSPVEVTFNVTANGELKSEAYTYLTVTYEELSAAGANGDVELKESGNVFEYIPTVTFNFEPKKGYSLKVAVADSEDFADFINAPTPEGVGATWTVTLLEGVPEGVTINVEVSEIKSTSIYGINAENGIYTVYNMQGVKVMESKDLEHLSNGLYIINGKKVNIRK